jgi:hypothetical protein
VTDGPGGYRDQDHRAEHAVLNYIEDPSPENAQAAELAGAKLDDRAETLAHGLEAVNALARQLESAHAAASQTRHWHDEFQALYRRHLDEVAVLRRKLSIARSLAWVEAHGAWVGWWFPLSWSSSEDPTERHLPDWFTADREPHQQDWWCPPGLLIRTDLDAFAPSGSGAVRQPEAAAIEIGDIFYLTDGDVYIAAEVTAFEKVWLLLRVRWRGAPTRD